MDCRAIKVAYPDTGYFSSMVTSYLQGDDALRPFYEHTPTKEGLKNAISNRQHFNTDRTLLHTALTAQYRNVAVNQAVSESLALLIQPGTFTITTAHQPNIFTGPFYFIYKILHAIKVAAHSKQLFPEYNFVPVYYMGSEDADLDELGHLFINGEKLVWQTPQTGAVGRMRVDTSLLQLIDRIEAETGNQPHGAEIISMLRTFYKEGTLIQDATFAIVHALFGRFGLLVVIPDTPLLKKAAIPFFEDELLHSTSSGIVEKTAAALQNDGFKVQAHGRDINLFYLQDGSRQRIERLGDSWNVVDTNITFTQNGILQELREHPERFSPNVILRGLFQETILPNIAFIGGGGELAYWLQLKSLFEHFKTPYPLLLLRNSFLVVEKSVAQKLTRLGFDLQEMFAPAKALQDKWVLSHSRNDLDISHGLGVIDKLYGNLSTQATPIDQTLLRHIDALKTQTAKKVTELGKKMLRAEKRNHDDAMRQIEKYKHRLFPDNSLQERVDNFIPYYAKWGSRLIDVLYQHSLALQQQFVIIEDCVLG